MRWKTYHSEANLSRKLCTRFHQNRPSFIKTLQNTLWSLVFLDTRYITVKHWQYVTTAGPSSWQCHNTCHQTSGLVLNKWLIQIQFCHCRCHVFNGRIWWCPMRTRRNGGGKFPPPTLCRHSLWMRPCDSYQLSVTIIKPSNDHRVEQSSSGSTYTMHK